MLPRHGLHLDATLHCIRRTSRGKLFYGTDHQPLHMDDRLLNYLQVVIATKMRRGESFTMTWTPAAGVDTGRVTLW